MLDKLDWMIVPVCLAMSIACYVLSAKSLYAISKCRKLRMSWMAWIPGWQHWTLGSIADNFRKAEMGKKSGWRWILTLVTVARNWLGMFYVIKMILLSFVSVFLGFIASLSSSAVPEDLKRQWTLLGILYWVVIGLIILQRILKTWVIYHVYRSCGNKKPIVKTALSIIPGMPAVFLSGCADREKEHAT